MLCCLTICIYESMHFVNVYKGNKVYKFVVPVGEGFHNDIQLSSMFED